MNVLADLSAVLTRLSLVGTSPVPQLLPIVIIPLPAPAPPRRQQRRAPRSRVPRVHLQTAPSRTHELSGWPTRNPRPPSPGLPSRPRYPPRHFPEDSSLLPDARHAPVSQRRQSPRTRPLSPEQVSPAANRCHARQPRPAASRRPSPRGSRPNRSDRRPRSPLPTAGSARDRPTLRPWSPLPARAPSPPHQAPPPAANSAQPGPSTSRWPIERIELPPSSECWDDDDNLISWDGEPDRTNLPDDTATRCRARQSKLNTERALRNVWRMSNGLKRKSYKSYI